MGNVEHNSAFTPSRESVSVVSVQDGSRNRQQSYWSRVSAAWRELSQAQKGASKSAPVYSRYVNRRMGRVFASLAAPLGMSPNQVTAVSAVVTFTGITLLVALPPTLGTGIAVACLLALGYALDSSDGQVARLQGSGSMAGEWLDHCIDAIKTSALPLAMLVSLWRFDTTPAWFLAVPLIAAVVCAVTFFLMILTEQFRLRMGRRGISTNDGQSGSSLRGWLVLPMDYGVMCWVFILWGAPEVFMVVYTLIILGSTGFLLIAMVKWYRELRALAQPGSGPVEDGA